jgi:hypothetical protein
LNPTPSQFRFAFRQLLGHAGKFISVNGNCEAQDETVLLTLSNTILTRSKIQGGSPVLDDQPTQMLENTRDVLERSVHCQGCILQVCRICTASIAYIAGFYVFSLRKIIHCPECNWALAHSQEDPCPNDSLILCKNFSKKSDGGLKIPSGSVCRLLLLCESIFRKHLTQLSLKQIEQTLVLEVLSSLNGVEIFPQLAGMHSLETAEGTDNHFLTLVHLISRKYFRLRIKKVLKDYAMSRSGGNALHRNRIFQNL